MAGGVRERILLAAREQLREAASDALAGAIDTLEERVLRHRGAGARARRGRPIDRMCEVLERDRALASAMPAQPASRADAARAAAPRPASTATPVPAAAAQPEPVSVVCDEPIRTRSMAKLLAAQGYAERALSIYAYLIAKDGSDPTLRAEAEALRQAQCAPAAQDGG